MAENLIGSSLAEIGQKSTALSPDRIHNFNPKCDLDHSGPAPARVNQCLATRLNKVTRETKMKKSIITAATLLLLSTLSVAAQNLKGSEGSSEGADGNPRPLFNQSEHRANAMKKNWYQAESSTTDALEAGDGDRMEAIPNYINRSQLR